MFKSLQLSLLIFVASTLSFTGIERVYASTGAAVSASPEKVATSPSLVINKITQQPAATGTVETPPYLESFLKGPASAKTEVIPSASATKGTHTVKRIASLKSKNKNSDPEFKVTEVNPTTPVAYYPQLMAVIYTGSQKQAILTLNGKSLSVNDGETTVCGKVVVISPTSVKVGAQLLSLN